MPFLGLREFVEHLGSNGQLLRLKDEVILEPDFSAASCAVLRQGSTAPVFMN